ncbi:MAG: Holliday junction resolvase RuvX [Acetobacter sp.]|nr:Holliday junction resolvase RuvX [Acetobacter sp.]
MAILFDISELVDLLPAQARLLGIDPGKKQVGLALSDVSRVVASPFQTLQRAKLGAMAKVISAFAVEHNIGGLVVGVPISLDGSFGPAAQASRDWALALAEQTGLPTCLWDERLSSSVVNRMLIQEADLSRNRRAQIVDRLAATYILQSALDALSMRKREL